MKIGTKMGGYQLLGLIARGGMGAVYEALEIQLDRKVALKVIAPPNPDDHDTEELIQRFMQEARTLARINHPNVITIYAIDTAKNVPFITMELVEGISFKELLRVSFLSAELATPMFIQMLEGLYCLHENRIVHRDLKPHNIMVRTDGQIKILDFGIAKPTDSGNLTHVGVVVGSLAYMAPEVKMGVAATERSDLWNIGAIFYECLTGKALPKAMAENPNSKEIPYPANSPVPLEVRAVIAKLCAYRPIERYENALQAIEDLRRFQRSRPPLATEALYAFGRKVEEVMAKRKDDSKDLTAADITPVQASSYEDMGEATTPYRREKPYVPRARRRDNLRDQLVKHWRNTPRWMIAAGLTSALLLVLALKPRSPDPAPQGPPPSVAQPVAQKTEEATPLRFVPPAPAAVVLLEPAHDSTLWLDPTMIPTLTWSREVKQNEFEIQISTDPAFRKILIKEPVSGNSYRPARVLAENKYYWRLQPQNLKGEVAGPHQFVLAHNTPVELIEPAAGHMIEIGHREKVGQAEFAWKCKTGIPLYQIQIGAGSNFTGALRESSSSDCRWREMNLSPGEYRWRVRVAEGWRGAKMWSEDREFTVKRGSGPKASPSPAPLALGKPALLESSDVFVLKFKNAPRDLASLAASLDQTPQLKWRAVRAAQKYVLQISAAPDFARLHSEHTLSAPQFEWQNAVPGTFYWRVAAVGSAASQGPYSDRASLKVLLPAPRLKSRFKFEVPLEGERQFVSWPAVPLAEKYVIQFATSRQLASADEQITTQPKFALPTKHGTYFMKVAAASSSGEVISPYSAVAAIVLDPVAVLDAPALKLPTEGATAVVRSGRLSITFEWSKVPKAESYVLEMSTDNDFTQVFERMTSSEASLLLKQMELRGRIYWRVRAENKEGSSAWSEPSFFEVRK